LTCDRSLHILSRRGATAATDALQLAQHHTTDD